MCENRRNAHLCIKGKVQGVFYRAWTEEQARIRGLSGWVRNRSDGSVEALFQGMPDQVSQMIEMCWQGPAAAQVEAIEVSEDDTTMVSGFEVRPTE